MKWKVLIPMLLGGVCLFAQSDTAWQYEALPNMPVAITNNAVIGFVNDQQQAYVYSFGGITTGLTYNEITTQAFTYDVANRLWDTLPPLPDTLGKIASAASVVKDKIYVIGGYHVFANEDEISSDRVHVFNPATNQYLADGSPVPVPIDDHVQAVWRDSLIYVVGGWSQTAHVNDVQIYNPTTDTWMAGTPLPGGIDYRHFGGSGVIIGDTIYYMGGARPGSTFDAAPEIRIGVIQPNQPDSIVWSARVFFGSAGYRMGAATVNGKPFWINGSEGTYNFNAASYDGGGVVNPLNRLMIYNQADETLDTLFDVFTPTMDMRGVAEVGPGQYIVCGGILDNAVVSNKTWLLRNGEATSLQPVAGADWQVYPNPVGDRLFVRGCYGVCQFRICNLSGAQVLEGSLLDGAIDVSSLAAGTYFLSACNEFMQNYIYIRVLIKN